jgi:hypothetical protein
MPEKQRLKYVIDQRLLVDAELYCGSDIHDVRSVLAVYKWVVEAANLGVQSGIDQIDVVETKLRTMLARSRSRRTSCNVG